MLKLRFRCANLLLLPSLKLFKAVEWAAWNSPASTFGSRNAQAPVGQRARGGGEMSGSATRVARRIAMTVGEWLLGSCMEYGRVERIRGCFCHQGVDPDGQAKAQFRHPGHGRADSGRGW